MRKLDRLSALISRFELSVTAAGPETANVMLRPAPPGEADADARMTAETAWRLLLSPRGRIADHAPRDAEPAAPGFSARFSWGGAANPLVAALPERLERRIARGDDLDMLARLLVSEQSADRCGAASVVDRLGEILIVRILREEIARGAAQPGLLAGLSDPRLARALVAIHESPERGWRNEDLAEIAGLSRSRFAELFHAALGEGPSAYLRRWRLGLARREIERGARVQIVARRYGYRSGEALNRAFHRAFGLSPKEIRPSGGAQAARNRSSGS